MTSKLTAKTNLKLNSGLWNNLFVKVDNTSTKKFATGEKVFILSNFSGVIVATIESTYFSGYYAVGDKNAYFTEQISLDAPNLQIWDYGSLVFTAKGVTSSPDSDNSLVAVGQVIGHIGEGKNRKVIFTPIDRVLKFVDKQIYKT